MKNSFLLSLCKYTFLLIILTSNLIGGQVVHFCLTTYKVAVCLGFQDFSQLTRDYGDKESKVIQNTVGNMFSGLVVGETAKTLNEPFGKVLQ